MKLPFAILTAACLAACAPSADRPFRFAAEQPLPLGIAAELPDTIPPTEVYTLSDDPRGPGCYYFDRDGFDVLLGCVG